jgi:hypothetical protein
MASIQWKKWNTKKGLKVRGTIKLSCDHVIEETFIGRNEDEIKKAIGNLIAIRTEGHGRNCPDKKK